MTKQSLLIKFCICALVLAPGMAFASGSGSHSHDDGEAEMLQQMQEMHKSHEHGHDFESMEEMTDEQRGRVMDFMIEVGLAVPPMNSESGRGLFVSKGCVVCHSVNGVGGEIGPSMNATDMPNPMNTFEFAARMWRGAGAMISMQEDLFGGQVELTGQDLADLVAFAHDAKEQTELSQDQIPDKFRQLIEQ